MITKINRELLKAGIKLNNKLYFSIGEKIYQYDLITQKHEIIITSTRGFFGPGLIFKNKLYFTTLAGKVHEYNPVTKEQKIAINANKTFSSPGFIFDNKLYLTSHDGKVYEYNPFKFIESNNLDLNELVINGLYTIHKKEDNNFQIKNILKIDIKQNNVKVIAKLISAKIISKELITNFIKQKINNHNETQIYNTPELAITTEENKALKVKKGLIITQSKSSTETNTSSYSAKHSWTIGAEAELKLFGTGVKVSNKEEGSYDISNQDSHSTEVKLENSFDTSTTNKIEKKENRAIIFKSQQILMKANEKIIYGLLPTCTCGGNNETEWIQQNISNWKGLFEIYSKVESNKMYQVCFF